MARFESESITQILEGKDTTIPTFLCYYLRTGDRIVWAMKRVDGTDDWSALLADTRVSIDDFRAFALQGQADARYFYFQNKEAINKQTADFYEATFHRTLPESERMQHSVVQVFGRSPLIAEDEEHPRSLEETIRIMRERLPGMDIQSGAVASWEH